MTAIKLSEYTGSHIVLNDEVEYVGRLHELLEEDELDEEALVCTVDDEPVWGHVVDADRVWTMVSDYLYEELGKDYAVAFANSEEAAKAELVEALNAWAAKHLTRTVLVETTTRVDISELFEGGEKATRNAKAVTA